MDSGSPAVGQGPLLDAYFEKRANLLLFIATRTGSRATAEDVIQDLYLKLAAQDPAIETASPVALVYRIAINLMLDLSRSARRSSERESAWRRETRLERGGEEVAEEPAADEVVVSRQRLRQLMEAVASLPPQRQRAFRLHKLEGLSQAETARAMGVSVKAIEQHISAALRTLTQQLQP